MLIRMVSFPGNFDKIFKSFFSEKFKFQSYVQILTTWTQISGKLLMNFIRKIHEFNILWINWIHTVPIACFNWNCRQKNFKVMAITLHHPLPFRATCDFLTLQRNFLGTNLPDGVTFNICKFWGNGCMLLSRKFRFFFSFKKKICTICAIPHRRQHPPPPS